MAWRYAPLLLGIQLCRSEIVFDPDRYRDFRLLSKEQIGDVWRLRYSLPWRVKAQLARWPLLPLHFDMVNPFITMLRGYTPISWDLENGTIDFLIKRYDRDGGGLTSRYACDLALGSSVRMSGPYSTIENKLEPPILMLAGGTGVTPFIQLLNRNILDYFSVTLVYAVSLNSEFALKDMLDSLAAKNPNFTVHYTKERLTNKILKTKIPNITNHTVLVCGPDGCGEMLTQNDSDAGGTA